MIEVTRVLLNHVYDLNAQAGYRDAEAVYEAARAYRKYPFEHNHYWSCCPSTPATKQCIKCYICRQEWIP